MSDNPFDVFAADLKAAVPPAESETAPAQGGPINIMAPPAPAPKSVMNQPVMGYGAAEQQAPTASSGMSMNGGGGGMGMGGMGMGGMGMPMGGNGGYGQQSMGMPMGGSMGGSMGSSAPAPSMGMNMGMGGMGMQPPAPAPQYNSMPMMGGMSPAPAAMVPSANPTNPYAMPTPPGPSPFDAPPAPASQPSYPASPSPASNDPWGGPPMGYSAPVPMGMGAPPAPPAMPYDAAPVVPAGSDDYGGPWGQSAPSPGPNAIVPLQNNMSDDPFGVFNAPGPGPAPTNYADPSDALSVATPANDHQLNQGQVLAAADGMDPWGDMGFGAPATSAGAAASTGGGGSLLGDDALVVHGDNNASRGGGHREGELPPGGEWYDARIFTPTLGVMFFKPQELTDSLFLQTDRSLVENLDDRPVVAFIVEGSSARAAGVELGHVLLKVNGIDVKNPKEASRLIKEGPRPLPLLFYVPDTTVVVAEGEHMVKYDTRETGAPNSAKDWKPKYCVIGGIIAQPWMMNMYRSKSEYDIAVIETQARRPVSVKVKQFSLQGARVQNDWQGPQMVKYKNKLHPWKYIVVLPVSRNPIKISSPNLAQLKPVHEGIRRVLMAQQRHNPNPPQVTRPQQSDQYGGRPQQQYGGPPSPQQQGGYSGNPPPQQQGGYSGPPTPQQQGGYSGPPPQQQQQGGYSGPPPQQQQYAQQSQQGYGGPPEQGGQYGGNEQQQSYSNAGGVGSARRTQPF
jgi:hypothetical protein